MAKYAYSAAKSGISSIVHVNGRLWSALRSTASSYTSGLFDNKLLEMVRDKLTTDGDSNGRLPSLVGSVESDAYWSRVLEDCVSLEFCCLVQSTFSGGVLLNGSVQVNNMSYHKEVFVRLTRNSWRTYTDIPTVHAETMSGGNTDRFLFAAPLLANEEIHFAVCYRVNGQEFWDNNKWNNYSLKVKV